MTAIAAAIDAIGSAADLARACNQPPQAVSRWKKTGKPPAKHCLSIEAATGISRHELRPDIFGPAPANQST